MRVKQRKNVQAVISANEQMDAPVLTIEWLIVQHGEDILASAGMEFEKTLKQHGSSSCYEHSVAVAYLSVWLALKFRVRVDMRSIIRGALLHDYFLYDWRDREYGWRDRRSRFHGFTHAQTALKNAKRDFALNEVEQDIIARHMFPLTLVPPKYRESVLICMADKMCAACEFACKVFPAPRPGFIVGRNLL